MKSESKSRFWGGGGTGKTDEPVCTKIQYMCHSLLEEQLSNFIHT